MYNLCVIKKVFLLLLSNITQCTEKYVDNYIIFLFIIFFFITVIIRQHNYITVVQYKFEIFSVDLIVENTFSSYKLNWK